VIAALLAALGVFAGAAPAAAPERQDISRPAAGYLLNCGGCHGITGKSSDSAVPTLRGQVASFLCLPEGRSFIVRLPNVAFAPLSDEELAGVMNFVVGVGAAKPQAGAVPYTRQEVAELRRRPLVGEQIASYRQGLVKRLIAECGAPSSLLDYK
jgi:mono/diheme cytochrome c family protein